MRICKSLLKNYINYNDYGSFDACNCPQHEPAVLELAASYISFDDKEDDDHNCVSSALQRHIKSRLPKELQKAVKDYVNYDEYEAC